MPTQRLTNVPELKAFLSRHGFAAKKSLGQHWLISEPVVRKIVAAASPAGGILEIGPGPGVLTQGLSEFAPVVALDIDSRVASALAESAPKADVVICDVLKIGLSEVLSRLDTPRVVVSNLPYYITAAVVERLCAAAADFERAVLMMQTEVAEKLAAEAGDRRRGSLSVLVQHYFEVSAVAEVPAGAFLPPPKVTSRVLLLQSRRSSRPLSEFEFVRDGFRQPRKTLANNLKAAGFSSDVIESALSELGVDSRVRPHFLSEKQWLLLAARLHSRKC